MINFTTRALKIPFSFNVRIDYKTFIDLDLNLHNQEYKCFPGVSPGWDNSSRRPVGKATIFEGSTPDKFKYWLSKKLQNFEPYSHEENFIMINAWNEWAEGNHLEPCKKWGLQFLEALNDEIFNYNKQKPSSI
ncbi:MAG: hypothetical protein EOL95_10555 [Bacteroidia bacterium]|nr:hypothetical protein [Bacteroidia bacterium]